jgi:hypothetical protein
MSSAKINSISEEWPNYEDKLEMIYEMGNIKLIMTPAKLHKPPCKSNNEFVSNFQ